MNKWVECLWKCAACLKQGEMRVWPYLGETPNATAARQSRWTRSSCVSGCMFSATAQSLVPEDGQ